MVFQKYKHGNIAILLLICMAILLISGYMIQNILQLNLERKVLKEDFQEQLTYGSIYEICAEEIIELLDNKSFYFTDRVINETDLQQIKQNILEYTEIKTDISINSPTAENLDSIFCVINDHKIKISNIYKEIIEVEVEEGEDIIRIIKLHMNNVKIEMVSVVNDN